MVSSAAGLLLFLVEGEHVVSRPEEEVEEVEPVDEEEVCKEEVTTRKRLMH